MTASGARRTCWLRLIATSAVKVATATHTGGSLCSSSWWRPRSRPSASQKASWPVAVAWYRNLKGPGRKLCSRSRSRGAPARRLHLQPRGKRREAAFMIGAARPSAAGHAILALPRARAVGPQQHDMRAAGGGRGGGAHDTGCLSQRQHRCRPTPSLLVTCCAAPPSTACGVRGGVVPPVCSGAAVCVLL